MVYLLALMLLCNTCVSEWERKLIGFGCNGAMCAGGLRGLLQQTVPWTVVFWCFAHRLELALKDTLKPTSFAQVDDLLLRIYYLYEKSPKNVVRWMKL